MVTLYYYIDSSKLESVRRFGLKLSENYSYTLPVNGLQKRFFAALLNPKDDLLKYNSEQFTCLKVHIYPDLCYVVNEISLIINPKNGDYGLIPLNDYVYGEFENPKVVFNSSILPEQIELLDDVMDEPILFESSKDLFYQSKVTELLDEMSPQEAYFALCDYIDYNKSKNKS